MENAELIVSIVHVCQIRLFVAINFVPRKVCCFGGSYVRMHLYFPIYRDFRLKILS